MNANEGDECKDTKGFKMAKIKYTEAIPKQLLSDSQYHNQQQQ